jgi:hypothetical protein
MKLINPTVTDNNDKELLTLKTRANYKALLLYDKLDRNSPYSKENMNLFTVGTIINIVV